MQSENKTVSNTQKILLATGDADWGKETHTNLFSLGFNCHVVREGKECQLTVYKEKFTTVFLDPDLKNHSGIEVLKYLKLNYPALRVVLIFQDQKRADEYKDLRANLNRIGVSKTFIRPFPLKSLVEYLNELTPSNSWKQPASSGDLASLPDAKIQDKDCTHVDVESFFTGNPAIFDYYIRLKQNHFVKIFRRGEVVDPDRVRKYAQDGVEYLYFLTSERRNYINYMNEVMQTTVAKENPDAKVMLSQIKNVSEKFMEEINTRGLRPDLVAESKAISQNVYGFIKKSPSLRKIMGDFEQFHPEEYSHAFLVSFFATVICKNLEWVGSRTLEAVTLGAYLHDIGLMKLPAALRDRDPASMNEKDLALFRQHPRMGADMLSTIPDINYQVIQVVFQHHERLHGGGYPNGLTGLKIYPLAKIVALADDFADFLVQKKVSPLEGIKLFLQDREKLISFDQSVIRALVTGFIKEEAKP